jgi:hypothetical protein
LRLAFVVDWRRREAVLHLMQLCTSRWGGIFCPILPQLRSRPGFLGPLDRDIKSGTDLTRGVLDAFEPDFVVESSPGACEGLDVPERLQVSLEDVERRPSQAPVDYGISAFELFRQAFRQEYRFVLRHPRPVVLPRARRERDTAFITALLGTFESDPEKAYLERAYRDVFEPEERELGLEDAVRLWLDPDTLVPARAAAYGFELRSRATPPPLLHIISPNSIRDLLDFWNLRAFGFLPMPVPAPALSALAPFFIEHLRSRSTVISEPWLAISPRLDPALADEFLDLFPDDPEDPTLTRLPPPGIPRLWDYGSRRPDRVQRVSPSTPEASTEVTARNGRIQFECPPLEFAERDVRLGPAWACEVELSESYWGSELGTVLPPTLKDVTSLVQSVGERFPVTSSRDGLVVRANSSERSQYWTLPSGLDVFKAWLSEGGDSRSNLASRTNHSRSAAGP